MDREGLLKHLRKTRLAPGDRDAAQSDARAIAAFLRHEFDVEEVIGIGSAFSPQRSFRQTSDIDLVVKGLDPANYFTALAKCADMTTYELDLIPYESASAAILSALHDEGVPVEG